jgi:predicted lipoprotein with Yx(FWY)xxD motif
MQSSPLGKYLVDADGHTLYLFEADEKGESYCNGACASVWPPFESDGTPQAMGGIAAGALGTTKRDDGDMQVTYHGHPLYFYAADGSVPGRTKGEDIKQFGASWYLLGANGKSIEPDESSGGNGGGNDNSGGGGGY